MIKRSEHLLPLLPHPVQLILQRGKWQRVLLLVCYYFLLPGILIPQVIATWVTFWSLSNSWFFVLLSSIKSCSQRENWSNTTLLKLEVEHPEFCDSDIICIHTCTHTIICITGTYIRSFVSLHTPTISSANKNAKSNKWYKRVLEYEP